MATFGPYALLRRLGMGGMGEVFLAVLEREEGFRKLLVIKRILPQLSRREDFRELFKREARLAALLSHQNIVQIFDYGQIDDQAFIAMEHVEGLDGATLLREHGEGLPPDIALRLLLEAARGLDHAHRKKGPDGAPLGLVHRDVNPRNLLVSFEGEVKWIDFGLAGALTREGDDRLLAGTVPYMSPEQAAGERVDARSDLFSLGVTAYELLCGHRPFDSGNDVSRQLELTRASDFVLPSEACGLPPEMDRFIQRALDPNPESRIPTAREMLTELEALASHIGVAPPRTLGELAQALAPSETRERNTLVERTQVGDDPLVAAAAGLPLTLPAEEPLVASAVGEAPATVTPEGEPEDAPEPAEPAVNQGPVTGPEPFPPRRRTVLWTVLALVALVAVAAGWVWLKGRDMTSNAGAQPGQTSHSVWRIDVSVEPGGAEVFLDNVRVGTTPLVMHDVEPGAYSTLTVQAEGYHPYEERLELGEGGGDLVVRHTLEAFDALLTLEISPADARVSINGEAVALPVTEYTVEAGTVVVVVEHPEHSSRTLRLDVAAGERKRERVSLDPLPGRLRIATSPVDSKVLVLDRARAVLRECAPPCVLEGLPVSQPLFARAEAEGHLPVELELSLQPGELRDITLTPKPRPRKPEGPVARFKGVGGKLYKSGRSRSSVSLDEGHAELRAQGFVVKFRVEPTADGESVQISLKTVPWSRVVINDKPAPDLAFHPLEQGRNRIRFLPQGEAADTPIGLDIRVR